MGSQAYILNPKPIINYGSVLRHLGLRKVRLFGVVRAFVQGLQDCNLGAEYPSPKKVNLLKYGRII